MTTCRQPAGVRIRTNTIFDVDLDAPDAPTASILELGFLVDGEDPDDHTLHLSPDEADTLAGWLASGTPGRLWDDARPWLAVEVSDGVSVIVDCAEDVGYVGGPELAGVLRAALADLAAHPPRRIMDYRAGVIEGVDASGQPCWLTVSVEAAVSAADAPRLVVGWRGAWWLDRADAAALVAGLEGGEVARFQEGHPDPWMVVRREAQGILFQLDDESMTDDDDGRFWMTEAAAAAMAGALRDALAHAADHPPHVFVPPEPFSRTVAEVDLAPGAPSR